MNTESRLYILWASKDVETFDEMVFMYASNGKKHDWWDEITVVIWGASARLTGEDEVVQLKIKELIEGNVKVEACKACADDLGVTSILEYPSITLSCANCPSITRITAIVVQFF